jgi:hypothetical protein
MARTGDIALMAHLMRRAGFGAGRDELEARVAKGYDATVEEDTPFGSCASKKISPVNARVLLPLPKLSAKSAFLPLQCPVTALIRDSSGGKGLKTHDKAAPRAGGANHR